MRHNLNSLSTKKDLHKLRN